MQPQKETLFHALMPLVSLFAERFRHMMLSRYWCMISIRREAYVLYIYPYMTCYPYTSYLVDHRSHQPNQVITNIDLLILRDRTDGRSACNPHVSKACNCLVSQTKHTNRHEALLIGSIGYDFTFIVYTMYHSHVSTTPHSTLHTPPYSM